ncbi:MAG: SPOR domain-containing protein [Bacteriovoracia bacterium]
MSQKTDNIIKLALVFFVSLLSFSVGTFVGKKYSDNQHKLALLEPKKAKQDAATPHEEVIISENSQGPDTGHTEANTGTEESNRPVALTDSEVAKIAAEFENDELGAEQNMNEKTVGTIDPEEKEVKTVTHASESAKRPTPIAKTTTEDREPASIRPSGAKTNESIQFTVQIASYPTISEAELLTKEMQGKGYKTSYVPATVNGQTWYRVNVGLFGSVKEAQDYKKDFLEKTQLSSAIIQRVQN